MSRTGKVASLVFVGAATAATVGYNVAPALAASNWVIRATSHHTLYHGPVAGHDSGNIKLVDKTHPVTLTCKKASISGSAPKSKIPVTGSSTEFGTIKRASINSCSFLGVTFKAHLRKSAGIFAKKIISTNVVSGNINSISALFSGANIPGCTFKVAGTHLPAFYHNTTHKFVVDPHSVAALTLKSVALGCPTIKTNDKEVRDQHAEVADHLRVMMNHIRRLATPSRAWPVAVAPGNSKAGRKRL